MTVVYSLRAREGKLQVVPMEAERGFGMMTEGRPTLSDAPR